MRIAHPAGVSPTVGLRRVTVSRGWWRRWRGALQDDDDDDDDDDDGPVEVYCTCKRPSYGEMIACDNAACKVCVRV